MDGGWRSDRRVFGIRWLLISYVVVLVLWGAKLCCNCASVWTPHLALLVFAAFGVAEVALRYVSLQHTNATGSFEPWESLARTLFVTLQARSERCASPLHG